MPDTNINVEPSAVGVGLDELVVVSRRKSCSRLWMIWRITNYFTRPARMISIAHDFLTFASTTTTPIGVALIHLSARMFS